MADHGYWYSPRESLIFVDYHGLDEKITTTTLTPRRHDFRDDTLVRDGPFCVVTGLEASYGDATHLAPESKGHEYILAVFNDRSIRYTSPSPISGIDDIQNGVLLAKHLHAMLADGSIAFIKTRNFGLEPADIVRVDRGPTLGGYITLQRLKAPSGFDPSLLSVLLAKPVSLMSSLPWERIWICDVWVKCWGIEASREMLQTYYKSHYKALLLTPNPHRGTDGIDDDEGSHCDDADDASQQQYSSVSRGVEMAAAMDKLNAYIMLLQGTSPEDAAKRWEKRVEEEERIAQQISAKKVMKWMRTMEVGDS